MYEVHDYIKSYLGENKMAHDFAKQFLEKRLKLKPPTQQVRKCCYSCCCCLSSFKKVDGKIRQMNEIFRHKFCVLF